MSKVKGLLNSIEEVLRTFEYPVYYGRSFAKEEDDWNYFVFNRSIIKKAGKSNCDYCYYYKVHIIMEDYVEEGFEQEVIKAIEENTRLKLSDDEMQFNYVTKSGTDTVVEMLTLTFCKTFRGCGLNG